MRALSAMVLIRCALSLEVSFERIRQSYSEQGKSYVKRMCYKNGPVSSFKTSPEQDSTTSLTVPRHSNSFSIYDSPYDSIASASICCILWQICCLSICRLILLWATRLLRAWSHSATSWTLSRPYCFI